MVIPIEVLARVREDIKQGEALLKDLAIELDKARLAGIDVTEQLKEAEALKQQIRQLKSVYGGR